LYWQFLFEFHILNGVHEVCSMSRQCLIYHSS